MHHNGRMRGFSKRLHEKHQKSRAAEIVRLTEAGRNWRMLFDRDQKLGALPDNLRHYLSDPILDKPFPPPRSRRPSTHPEDVL